MLGRLAATLGLGVALLAPTALAGPGSDCADTLHESASAGGATATAYQAECQGIGPYRSVDRGARVETGAASAHVHVYRYWQNFSTGFASWEATSLWAFADVQAAGLAVNPAAGVTYTALFYSFGPSCESYATATVTSFGMALLGLTENTPCSELLRPWQVPV